MSLKTQAVKSVAWYAATRFWMQAVSWVVTLILARLLTPGDYGLFAMAFAVITFLEIFQEFGLGAAIIQRQDLTNQQLNTVFWMNFSASFIVMLFAFLGANIGARFYGDPRLIWMIRCLSLSFLLNALGMVPYNLLTKEIDFRRRSLSEACGVIISSGVSLSLAFMDYEVWALVGGYLARAVVRNTAMLFFSGWMPGFDLSFRDIGSVIKFGLNIAGSYVFTTISTVVNTSIVGRFLGGSDLGFYTMADALGKNNPIHKLSTSVINQLSLPIFSRLQSDDEQLRRYFLKITKYLAVISLPLQIGMALVANDLVHVLLSEKWLPIVGILQAFAVGGVFSVVILPAAPVLTARGRPHVVFRLSGISAIAMMLAVLVGAQFGLAGVATAWLIVFPCVRLYLLSLSLKEIDLTMWTYLQSVFSSLFATAIMMTTVLVRQIFISSYTEPLERLILNVTIGAMVYSIVLLLIDRKFGIEMKLFIRELFAVSKI